MVQANYMLLAFTSVASKEAEEGIAYQLPVEAHVRNEAGDPGVGAPFGSCKNISMPSSPMTSSAGSFSGSVQFSKSASTVCYPNRFVVGFISIPWMFMRASG
ncbi:hypothetical protein V6N13_053318 [Hibiscus sabdariffa]